MPGWLHSDLCARSECTSPCKAEADDPSYLPVSILSGAHSWREPPLYRCRELADSNCPPSFSICS